MPELGRAALVLCLGLALYALAAGGYAAAEEHKDVRERRLPRSAPKGTKHAHALVV